MSDLALRVESLSKVYPLRHRARPRYATLREDIMHRVRRLFRKGTASTTVEKFQALRDVSFELEVGATLGIVGRNGAGKSTLLKLLSRITDPTSGRISLNGRVASLLEVGTGFHPELTGRENIFLNGAILGMSRAEIRRKFDEIVAFAETERFLDTPVKHYSSGMYMRLAFAVAAHLEPDILIVDEVLAVGDQEFQNKCLGRMREVSQSGHTVLFVSHNLTAIGTLCQKGLLLAKGSVMQFGRVQDTLAEYRRLTETQAHTVAEDRMLRSARVVSVCEDAGPEGMNIELEFELELPEDRLGLDLIVRHGSYPVLFASSAYYGGVTYPRGRSQTRCVIGPLNLASGTYEIDVHVCRPQVQWLEENAGVVEFSVDRQHGQNISLDLAARRLIGFVIPPQRWS